ncbi:hypothetical protein LA284_004330 [Vibrio vulnificus]|nr:hypothetical protein [Vibrio vulnificus]EID0719174.1 hypothetical protein [Vibrio vulnificus]EID0743354.1 hypothetical protein [Vibrio vulnificus]EJL7820235.1 hypothetical protein [Vibrio vulnificus]
MLNHQKVSGLWFFFVPSADWFCVCRQVGISGRFSRAIILWRWKFKELPQSIFGQARGWGGWLNQQSALRFLSFDCQSSMSDFQNYESFLFSAFWFLFVNQSRVNLGLGIT